MAAPQPYEPYTFLKALLETRSESLYTCPGDQDTSVQVPIARTSNYRPLLSACRLSAADSDFFIWITLLEGPSARPTHGAPLRPPRCGAPLQPFLGHARQAARALSRLARPLLFPTLTCLIQTSGSQEPASGNSPAARRLWRWQTSRGGRTAPLLRRSSGAVRLFLRQTNLGLYGAAHGIRRAVPAQ